MTEDKTLPLRSLVSIKTLVGVGVLLGTFLPWFVGIAIAAGLLWKACSGYVLRRFGGERYADPLTKLVVPGRKTVDIKGDFVVFHIGARAHKKLDQFFREMGDAFREMLQELEENPSLGCLGSEQFVGVTGFFIVQYWRSLDQLNAYARSSTNRHASAWAKVMRVVRKSNDYGIWHETFEVKEGNYECIFGACPPMMLGNCHQTSLIDCKGRNKSAAGRAGKTDGSDYPEELMGGDKLE